MISDPAESDINLGFTHRVRPIREIGVEDVTIENVIPEFNGLIKFSVRSIKLNE